MDEQVPAFPLGGVLLPGQLLDLQVFEPRYRVMLFDLREARPAEFLVTLIERGSEVGGGEIRSPVGCMAEVLAVNDAGSGLTHLQVVGTQRAVVREWLEDDPYPRASIERSGPGGDAAGSDATALAEAFAVALRRGEAVLRAAERLGMGPADPEPVDPTDPVTGTWQLALRTPLGTLDRYRLLEEPDPLRRLHRLAGMLEEAAELLEALARGEGDGE